MNGVSCRSIVVAKRNIFPFTAPSIVSESSHRRCHQHHFHVNEVRFLPLQAKRVKRAREKSHKEATNNSRASARNKLCAVILGHTHIANIAFRRVFVALLGGTSWWNFLVSSLCAVPTLWETALFVDVWVMLVMKDSVAHEGADSDAVSFHFFFVCFGMFFVMILSIPFETSVHITSHALYLTFHIVSSHLRLLQIVLLLLVISFSLLSSASHIFLYTNPISVWSIIDHCRNDISMLQRNFSEAFGMWPDVLVLVSPGAEEIFQAEADESP